MAAVVAITAGSSAAAGSRRCHAAKLEAPPQQSNFRSRTVCSSNAGAGVRCSSLRWGASAEFLSGAAPWLSFGARRRCASSRNAAVVAAVDIERSYIMIKPDGVQRGLVGEIISRFERKGFTLRGLKLFRTPQDLAEKHYGDLKEKPFFPKLVEYIISGPVVAMVWEGPGVVASARKLIGVTNPLNAEPGTIRGDFAVNTGRNIIHGSDSPENGAKEIALWFKEGEVLEWEATITPWLLE